MAGKVENVEKEVKIDKIAPTIEIGRFRLNRDNLQFIVSAVSTLRTGLNKGESIEGDYTYHATLLHAAENIMKRKVLASKVSTIEGLVGEIKNQNKMMQGWFNESLKAGVALERREQPEVPKKDQPQAITKVARKMVDDQPKKKLKAIKKANK